MKIFVKMCTAALLISGLLASAQNTVTEKADGQPPARVTLSDPSIKYTVSDKPYVVLKRGPVQIVVVDNSEVNDPVVLPVHKTGYNGIGSLTFENQGRNLFKSNYGGLNFEYIFDGSITEPWYLGEARHGVCPDFPAPRPDTVHPVAQGRRVGQPCLGFPMVHQPAEGGPALPDGDACALHAATGWGSCRRPRASAPGHQKHHFLMGGLLQL